MHFVDDHRFSIHRARVTQVVKWFRRGTQGFLFARKTVRISFLLSDLAQLKAVQTLECLFLLVNQRCNVCNKWLARTVGVF